MMWGFAGSTAIDVSITCRSAPDSPLMSMFGPTLTPAACAEGSDSTKTVAMMRVTRAMRAFDGLFVAVVAIWLPRFVSIGFTIPCWRNTRGDERLIRFFPSCAGVVAVIIASFHPGMKAQYGLELSWIPYGTRLRCSSLEEEVDVL